LLNETLLDRVRLLGLVEGVSTLVLFGVAMPLKYFVGMPMAVTIAGSIHGALFLALVGAFLYASGAVPLPARLTLAGIIGAVVPFGPFVVDARLRRYAARLRPESEPAEA
jgi:integral membrane protein